MGWHSRSSSARYSASLDAGRQFGQCVPLQSEAREAGQDVQEVVVQALQLGSQGQSEMSEAVQA